MRKVILLFLVCIIFSSTLTGCYDAKELTEWTYVYSIGMDHGIKDKLRMSIQIPTVKGSSSNNEISGMANSTISSEEKEGLTTISIDCPSFYAGINMINTFLSRELNYMHTKFIVFSEKLAKDGIETYLNGFPRGRQIRRQLYIIISRDSARDFLKENVPRTSSSLTKMQEAIITQQSKNTGYFPHVSYGDVTNSLKTSYGQIIIPLAAVNNFSEFWDSEETGSELSKTSGEYYAGELPRIGGSKVEFLGTAIFDGGKMVGELNGDETRALLMTRGEFKKGNFAITDPKNSEKTVSLNISQQKKPKVKVNLTDSKPIIDLTVYLEGEILAIQSTIEYEKKELKPLLEDAFKEQIKMNLESTIKKCQYLNSDVFKFGSVAGVQFRTIQEFESYNWLSKFKDASVNVSVQFSIKRTGTMLKNKEPMSSEGKQTD